MKSGKRENTQNQHQRTDHIAPILAQKRSCVASNSASTRRQSHFSFSTAEMATADAAVSPPSFCCTPSVSSPSPSPFCSSSSPNARRRARSTCSSHTHPGANSAADTPDCRIARKATSQSKPPPPYVLRPKQSIPMNTSQRRDRFPSAPAAASARAAERAGSSSFQQ